MSVNNARGKDIPRKGVNLVKLCISSLKMVLLNRIYYVGYESKNLLFYFPCNANIARCCWFIECEQRDVVSWCCFSFANV